MPVHMVYLQNEVQITQLAITKLRTAKHLWVVWQDNAMWQETFKVKIGARKYKRFLVTVFLFIYLFNFASNI